MNTFPRDLQNLIWAQVSEIGSQRVEDEANQLESAVRTHVDPSVSKHVTAQYLVQLCHDRLCSITESAMASPLHRSHLLRLARALIGSWSTIELSANYLFQCDSHNRTESGTAVILLSVTAEVCIRDSNTSGRDYAGIPAERVQLVRDILEKLLEFEGFRHPSVSRAAGQLIEDIFTLIPENVDNFTETSVAFLARMCLDTGLDNNVLAALLDNIEGVVSAEGHTGMRAAFAQCKVLSSQFKNALKRQSSSMYLTRLLYIICALSTIPDASWGTLRSEFTYFFGELLGTLRSDMPPIDVQGPILRLCRRQPDEMATHTEVIFDISLKGNLCLMSAAWESLRTAPSVKDLNVCRIVEKLVEQSEILESHVFNHLKDACQLVSQMLWQQSTDSWIRFVNWAVCKILSDSLTKQQISSYRCMLMLAVVQLEKRDVDLPSKVTEVMYAWQDGLDVPLSRTWLRVLGLWLGTSTANQPVASRQLIPHVLGHVIDLVVAEDQEASQHSLMEVTSVLGSAIDVLNHHGQIEVLQVCHLFQHLSGCDHRTWMQMASSIIAALNGSLRAGAVAYIAVNHKGQIGDAVEDPLMAYLIPLPPISDDQALDVLEFVDILVHYDVKAQNRTYASFIDDLKRRIPFNAPDEEERMAELKRELAVHLDDLLCGGQENLVRLVEDVANEMRVAYEDCVHIRLLDVGKDVLQWSRNLYWLQKALTLDLYLVFHLITRSRPLPRDALQDLNHAIALNMDMYRQVAVLINDLPMCTWLDTVADEYLTSVTFTESAYKQLDMDSILRSYSRMGLTMGSIDLSNAVALQQTLFGGEFGSFTSGACKFIAGQFNDAKRDFAAFQENLPTRSPNAMEASIWAYIAALQTNESLLGESDTLAESYKKAMSLTYVKDVTNYPLQNAVFDMSSAILWFHSNTVLDVVEHSSAQHRSLRPEDSLVKPLSNDSVDVTSEADIIFPLVDILNAERVAYTARHLKRQVVHSAQSKGLRSLLKDGAYTVDYLDALLGNGAADMYIDGLVALEQALVTRTVLDIQHVHTVFDFLSEGKSSILAAAACLSLGRTVFASGELKTLGDNLAAYCSNVKDVHRVSDALPDQIPILLVLKAREITNQVPLASLQLADWSFSVVQRRAQPAVQLQLLNGRFNGEQSIRDFVEDRLSKYSSIGHIEVDRLAYIIWGALLQLSAKEIIERFPEMEDSLTSVLSHDLQKTCHQIIHNQPLLRSLLAEITGHGDMGLCHDFVKIFEEAMKASQHFFNVHEAALELYASFLHDHDLAVLTTPSLRGSMSDVLLATLRVAKLFVEYPHVLEHNWQKNVADRVPVWCWRKVLPQLLSRLSHASHTVRRVMGQVLHIVADANPETVAISIVSAQKREENSALQDGFWSEIRSVFMRRNPVVWDQAYTMVNEISDLSMLPEEMWGDSLATILRHAMDRLRFFGAEYDRIVSNHHLSDSEKHVLIAGKYSAMMKTALVKLGHLVNRTRTLRETPYNFMFACRYGYRLQEAIEQVTSPADYRTCGEAWQRLRQLSKTLDEREKYIMRRGINLHHLCPGLASTRTWRLPVPFLHEHFDFSRTGITDLETDGGNGFVLIDEFCAPVNVIATKTKPKKICIGGADGRHYPFLFKGEEDLHLDERIMQLLSLINAIFSSATSTHNLRSSPKQMLQVRKYAVIPLGPSCGLIQWVMHAESLYDIYRDWQHQERNKQDQTESAVLQQRPMDHFYSTLVSVLRDTGMSTTNMAGISSREMWTPQVLRTVYEELCRQVPNHILRHRIWSRCVSPMDWWRSLETLTRSLSASNMVGHVLGLGDRHLDNILMDRRSNEIVHIDYGVCFDKGQSLRVPETIPFRMTRNIVGSLPRHFGLSVVREQSCRALKTLSQNADTLLALMDTFIYDPLVDWSAAHAKRIDQLDLDIDVARSLLGARLMELRSSFFGKAESFISDIRNLEGTLNRALDASRRRRHVLDNIHDRMHEIRLLAEHGTTAATAVQRLQAAQRDLHIMTQEREKAIVNYDGIVNVIKGRISAIHEFLTIGHSDIQRLFQSTHSVVAADVDEFVRDRLEHSDPAVNDLKNLWNGLRKACVGARQIVRDENQEFHTLLFWRVGQMKSRLLEGSSHVAEVQIHPTWLSSDVDETLLRTYLMTDELRILVQSMANQCEHALEDASMLPKNFGQLKSRVASFRTFLQRLFGPVIEDEKVAIECRCVHSIVDILHELKEKTVWSGSDPVMAPGGLSNDAFKFFVVPAHLIWRIAGLSSVSIALQSLRRPSQELVGSELDLLVTLNNFAMHMNEQLVHFVTTSFGPMLDEMLEADNLNVDFQTAMGDLLDILRATRRPINETTARLDTLCQSLANHGQRAIQQISIIWNQLHTLIGKYQAVLQSLVSNEFAVKALAALDVENIISPMDTSGMVNNALMEAVETMRLLCHALVPSEHSGDQSSQTETGAILHQFASLLTTVVWPVLHAGIPASALAFLLSWTYQFSPSVYRDVIDGLSQPPAGTKLVRLPSRHLDTRMIASYITNNELEMGNVRQAQLDVYSSHVDDMVLVDGFAHLFDELKALKETLYQYSHDTNQLLMTFAMEQNRLFRDKVMGLQSQAERMTSLSYRVLSTVSPGDNLEHHAQMINYLSTCVSGLSYFVKGLNIDRGQISTSQDDQEHIQSRANQAIFRLSTAARKFLDKQAEVEMLDMDAHALSAIISDPNCISDEWLQGQTKRLRSTIRSLEGELQESSRECEGLNEDVFVIQSTLQDSMAELMSIYGLLKPTIQTVRRLAAQSPGLDQRRIHNIALSLEQYMDRLHSELQYFLLQIFVTQDEMIFSDIESGIDFVEQIYSRKEPSATPRSFVGGNHADLDDNALAPDLTDANQSAASGMVFQGGIGGDKLHRELSAALIYQESSAPEILSDFGNLMRTVVAALLMVARLENPSTEAAIIANAAEIFPDTFKGYRRVEDLPFMRFAAEDFLTVQQTMDGDESNSNAGSAGATPPGRRGVGIALDMAAVGVGGTDAATSGLVGNEEAALYAREVWRGVQRKLFRPIQLTQDRDGSTYPHPLSQHRPSQDLGYGGQFRQSTTTDYSLRHDSTAFDFSSSTTMATPIDDAAVRSIVDDLMHQAMDSDRLAQLFEGWTAWI